MSTRRLIVKGRVQGVGYRAWAARHAETLGLAGWVRNRADGVVELMIDGDAAAVEEMLRACRRGPRLAEVAEIEEEIAEALLEDAGFLVLPNA